MDTLQTDKMRAEDDSIDPVLLERLLKTAMAEDAYRTTGTPEELFERLSATIQEYHPSKDVSQVRKAYEIAAEAHKEQKRKSGEPYIIHPLAVAIILADLEMDKESIIAGILHDVVEDTTLSLAEVGKEFGEEIALLVDGVTKLTRLSFSEDKMDVQAENLRKMFVAMAKDIRVIIIKLADRLHNMRTLQFMTPEKQKEKAKETMDIFCPIAQRLGISKIKDELDSLSLIYLDPEAYAHMVDKVNLTSSTKGEMIKGIVDDVRAHMQRAGIKAEVYGRVKHYFSIYRKMVTRQKSLDEVYDIYGVRIIVDTVKDCYGALGVIHEMYTPVPGRFKDYIAMPKANMYQSLHTTLLGENGQPFEIQIRTWEMHRTAEYGIAAHWKYKENQSGRDIEEDEAKKFAWLRQILEWQQDMSDNGEFLVSLKADLNMFSDYVYCFTPQGDVKSLPKGSTPIDFAYSIHTAVGNRMIGARVNERMVPITYELQNGDRVDIITSQNSKGPSMDWLKIVKSAQARTKINQWFRSQNKEENTARGKELVERALEAKNLSPCDVVKPEYIQTVLRKFGFRDWDSMLAAVGHGGLKEGQVVNKLAEEYEKAHRRKLSDEEVLSNVQSGADAKPRRHRNASGVIVSGMPELACRLSRCCAPLPGDEIIGFITRGRGVTVHRTDCVNVLNLSESERSRLIEVEWEVDDVPADQPSFNAEIILYAENRVGILADISQIFSERGINITSLNSRTSRKGLATISIAFGISGRPELNKIVEKLRQVRGVSEVERTRG